MHLRYHRVKKHIQSKKDPSNYIRKFVSQGLYGTLIVMSLIVALDKQQKTPGQVIVSLLTTVLAFAIAHFYSEMIADRIVSKEKLTIKKLKNLFYEIAPIGIGSHIPTIIFFFALFGFISIEKAFLFAKVAGLGALFLYGFLVGKYSNKSKYNSFFIGAINMLIGAIVVVIKALVH
ncbi:hypothetical protein [Sporosalibacterium faouarense]|uniref:hypothetical protein n=1 Tax=Sporosalibacterium faouarense TaxID=516123 RepID=UPI00141C7B8D|nr:hypothetical protein [Sporosalibacterium faouarense]MTI47147.1 hypothetical protein [Bacillota bacterium]